MKKKQWVVIVLLLFLGTLSSVTAGAGRPPFPPGGSEADLLARSLLENQAVQVLAQLTKQPPEAIRQKLCKARLPDVVERYRIDPEIFRKAMRAKLTAMANALEKTGYITRDQGEEILAEGEKDEERHALMSRLIEKGIKDGTLTLEQARLLVPQPPHR